MNWTVPPKIAHLVTERVDEHGRAFTFMSWNGNYDFMVKANYKICASAMPQLQCRCRDKVLKDGTMQ
jgi:hypothetical protein